MAFPFALFPAIKTAVKIVSKILPSKPKAVVEEMVDEIIRSDKEIQTELMNSRQFYLDFFRPDLLPQWAVAIKNLWRPFVAIVFSLYNLVYYTVCNQMPDKYFLVTSTGIIFTMVLGRTAEKWRKKIV